VYRPNPPVRNLLLIATVWLGTAGLVQATAADHFVVLPESGNRLTVLCNGETYMDLEFVGWGRNWAWMGFQDALDAKDGRTHMVNRAKLGDAEIRLAAHVKQPSPRQLEVAVELATSQDVELTYIVVTLNPAAKHFARGKLVAETGGEKPHVLELPLGRQPVGDAVRRLVVEPGTGSACGVTLEPACDVTADGAVRIVLAGGTFRATTPVRRTFTFDFPANVTFYADRTEIPADPGMQDWFAFTADEDHAAPSEIGMEDWLEQPAGKHGRIRRQADELVYNGRPIKLWGLNLCYGTCAPDKELAEQRARFYAKYGVNSVRLHKYADGPGWAGIQSEESFAQFDPAGLDRMDYLVAKLKEKGIYIKFSAHFGAQKLGPADREFVPYLDELGSFGPRENRVTTPHSAVHYAPELQDVQIRQMVNLLRHRNPHTGLTYAEDPAIAFIEIINEQSILFFTSMNPLKESPSIRRHAARRFCDWLRDKYGTHEKLVQRWGANALDSFAGDGFTEKGEHLDKNNILPLGNPWYWDPAQLESSQAFRGQRLLDSLEFLYVLQNEFYSRYVQAVRRAGYEGEIVSSNWQAGRAFSHYYNLHSDALVGTIDRHNYFGGGDGNRIDNATMLAVPGSGILSAGMQQVADRPFMLSEWIHVAPNEWGVEGPAIIGAYGLGLQGWDVSYLFQNRDAGTFSRQIGKERWDVAAPQITGVFPAVARSVLRGDVRESEHQATRHVHVDSFRDGRLGFEDTVLQSYDVKSFQSDKVPAATLALARCGVQFGDQFRDTPQFDVQPFLHDEYLTSSTSQLRWKPGSSKLDGFFSINTPATKAVVGFANGQTVELENVTVKPSCRFAAIYLTAKEVDRDLATSRNLLIVAIARARNSGMKVFNDDRVLQRGEPPVVMEPVKAEITIRGRGTPTVIPLDHNGRRTNRTLAAQGETFTIDGARDKTCYYLVRYQ